MMRVLALGLALFWPPLAAEAQQTLPALYDVTGVAANDVLNIRAEPKASADILGSLPRDAKGVEVVAVNAAGTWGTVNTAEGTGYVALRFLAQQGGPDWGALESPLHCGGTEPFWGLDLDPARRAGLLSDPGTQGQDVNITALWQNGPYLGTAAVAFKGNDIDGLANLRGQNCSDGMSDRSYGIVVDLFLRDQTGAASAAFSGCCTLTP